MNLKKKLVLALVFCLSAQLYADEVSSAIDTALKDMVALSVKSPYSPIIEEMFLGYDTNDEIRVGIAMRSIKTYEKVTGIVVVRKTSQGFVIEAADMPDIGKIKSDEKRDRVLSAITAFRGKPVDPKSTQPPVDGVTGATRYYKRIFAYYNIMAMKLVEEMEKRPDWPKEKL